MTNAALRKIPIKNVYHMLAFVWNIPLSQQQKQLSTESFQDMDNLLAVVFEQQVSTLLKRGLAKEYVEVKEAKRLLKGKLLITDTLKEQAIRKKQVVCQHDELTEDITINQIVKTALYALLRMPDISTETRKRLKMLCPFFHHIQFIEFNHKLFSTFKIFQRADHYAIVMSIARLIYEMEISNEQQGKTSFLSIMDETKLNKLFEKFLFSYYRKRLSPEYKVYSPVIRWQLSGNESVEDVSYLPQMETDLVIEHTTKQLIVDAKFYEKTVTTNQFGQERLYSANLYQLFTYMNNSPFVGRIEGMLVYPTIQQNFNLQYEIAN